MPVKKAPESKAIAAVSMAACHKQNAKTSAMDALVKGAPKLRR